MAFDERSVGAAVASACRSAADAFAENDPLGAASPTPDHVHDARVALRRVRSCLRSFGAFFPGDWARDLRADLKWYGTELSAIRDLDVFAVSIASLGEKSIPERERNAALELLSSRRTSEVQRLSLLRDDPRHRLAVVRLEALGSGMPLSRRANLDATTGLPRALRGPYKAVRSAGRKARSKPTVARLHVVRIRAKELRYAAELAAPVLGEPAVRLGRASQRVQDEIGNQRDALLAADFLDLALIGRHAPELRSGRIAAALRREARVDPARLRRELRQLTRAWKNFDERADH